MKHPERFVDSKQVHPAILNVTLPGVGTSVPHQRVFCAHEGCENSHTVRLTDGKVKPFKRFVACAAQRGWVFSDDEFYCKQHAPKVEEPMPQKADTQPREMTKEERRAIFREIDESYDKTGYVLDVTDKTIADKLHVPWGWVAEIREELFGPSGPDPRLVELGKKLDAAEKRAQSAYDKALSAAESADSAVAEVRALKAQLAALLGS